MQVQFIKLTKNKKTGKMPVTTTESKSCPQSCPMLKHGCYNKAGYHTGRNWKKIDTKERGSSWELMCANVNELDAGTVWRHNIGGDLPHYKEIIDFPAVKQLVAANMGKRGFTFTHHDMAISGNRAVVKFCNNNGFTVNLSADSLPHADVLAEYALGPIATILKSDHTERVFYTPKGRKGVQCPATYRDDVTCKQCKLCAVKNRKVIIGFPAHGNQAKIVDLIIQESEKELTARVQPRDAKGRFLPFA